MPVTIVKSALKIAIVGYGIAGIATAIHLRRRGHAVEHYERRSDIEDEGAGLLLQPPALTLLRDLGVATELFDCAAKVYSFGAEDLRGRALTKIRYADHAPGSYALGIQRRALIDGLRNQDEGFGRVQFNRAALSVDAGTGVLHMADGSQHGPYDLIVAADGANSPLRNGLAHLILKNRLYPSAALVACVDDPEGLAGDRLVQVFDAARHVALWPVGCFDGSGPRRANISINVPLDRAEAFRASGAWKGVVERHCPKLTSLIEALDVDFNPIIYAYRDVALHRCVAGRLVFIGDAAHSMSPLLGQGARMALLDASMLAQALDSHDEVFAALRSYDQCARAKVAEFQRISRWLTPVFQSESLTLATVRHVAQIAHRLPFVAARARDLLIGS